MERSRKPWLGLSWFDDTWEPWKVGGSVLGDPGASEADDAAAVIAGLARLMEQFSKDARRSGLDRGGYWR